MLSRTGRIAVLSLLVQMGALAAAGPAHARSTPRFDCSDEVGWCCVLAPQCTEGVYCCWFNGKDSSHCGCGTSG